MFHDVTVRYSLNRTGPHGCRVYSSMKRHSFVNDFPLLLSCRLCCAIVEVFPHLTLQVCCAHVLKLDVCDAGPSGHARAHTHAHTCAHIEKTEIELEENEQNYEVM